MRGITPTPDNDDIGGFDSAVVEDNRLDVLGAAQLPDARPEAQGDAVFGVEPAEHRADVVAEHALERHGGGVDQQHVGAHLPGRGRDLAG